MACIDSSVVRYCNSLIVDWLSQIHGCEHIQFLHLLGIDGDKQWRAVVFSDAQGQLFICMDATRPAA